MTIKELKNYLRVYNDDLEIKLICTGGSGQEYAANITEIMPITYEGSKFQYAMDDYMDEEKPEYANLGIAFI